MSRPSSSITFGVLSRSSFEQMLSSAFGPPPERLVVSLPLPSQEGKETDFTPPPPRAPPSPPGPAGSREQCIAKTLGDSRCKNLAKPSLSYCYIHRGQSSTKNTECPICLEKFIDSPDDVFLLSCAHQLHNACLAQLRTDSCPICRSRLTNLSKELDGQIRARKIQDTTERKEEELQEAIARLGQGMSMIPPPFLLTSFPATDQPAAWPPFFTSQSAPISLSHIFEDFIVRQNAATSVQPE